MLWLFYFFVSCRCFVDLLHLVVGRVNKLWSFYEHNGATGNSFLSLCVLCGNNFLSAFTMCLHVQNNLKEQRSCHLKWSMLAIAFFSNWMCWSFQGYCWGRFGPGPLSHRLWFCFVIGAQKFKDAFEAAQEKVSVKSEKEAADATECNKRLKFVICNRVVSCFKASTVRMLKVSWRFTCWSVVLVLYTFMVGQCSFYSQILF